MRVSTFCVSLLIAGCIQVNAQQVSFREGTVSLKQAFEKLETSSNYKIAYNDSQLDVSKKVILNQEEKEILQVLEELLADTGYTYKLNGNYIVIIPGSQKNTRKVKKVTGVIKDATGEPVIGANVLMKGGSADGSVNGTITDINGVFEMEVPDNAILQISYIGYEPQDVPIRNSEKLNIRLKEDSQSLEEVVVMGYGVQKKKLVTGATVQVKGDEIVKRNTSTVLDALKGQTPGMSIQKVSAQPGDGFKVNIRGLGTTGNSAPLYIVDGVTVPDINSLNPSDIESIDVLKDAASAAIYGSRASNGVILIVTKHGKVGKPSISYDGYYGIQNVAKKLDYVNAQDYLMLLSEYYTNNNAPIPDFAPQIPGYENIADGTWKGTDWMKETTNKNAPIQNHSLNVTGGTEQSIYSLGLSLDSQEGIVGKPAIPTYDRYTFRMNTELLLIKDKNLEILKVGENFNFSHTTRRVTISENASNQQSFATVASGCPLIRLYNPDPTDQGPYTTYYPYDVYGGPVGVAPTAPNPIAYLDYAKSGGIRRNNDFNGNVYLTFQPIKGLIFRSSFGINSRIQSDRNWVPAYCLTATTASSYFVNNVDKTTQMMSSGMKWMFDNTLSYKFEVNKTHSFDVLLGTSAEKDGIGESLTGSNGNSLFDSFDYAYLVNNKTVDPSYTTLSGQPLRFSRLLSFFGRASYDYKQTYMATVVLRTDGSSNFAPGNQWGYFPSVSAGWAVSNETFMEDTKSWLDFFKIRASWGQNGNQSISPFQYLSTVSFMNANFFKYSDKTKYIAGGYPNIIANPDITWETSVQTDFGIDARFLNSRLGVTFDWYKKQTIDWLIQAPILATDGTGAPYINGGDVENRGFEVALTWSDQLGDFNYTIAPNFTQQKNEVTRIANPEGIIHGNKGVLHADQTESYRAQVGYPIGYFWGLQSDGLFQNPQQVQDYKNKDGKLIQSGAKPGDMKFVDQNGDGVIDQKDNVMLGDPNPDFIFGFSLNASYKGFDLTAVGSGVLGNQVIWNYFNNNGHGTYNWSTLALKRWHGEGTSNSYPRINTGSTQDITMSDRFVSDAGFLRLTNLTLGYDFNRLWKRSPLKQARLFLSAQNLFTLTSYQGYNPEVGSNGPSGGNWAGGVDTTPYPLARTFMIGVSMKY